MAVLNFNSGKALLLLRETHLPSSINLSSNIPTSKQGLTCFNRLCRFEIDKFSQKPFTKPILATNSPQFWLIWAYFAHFCEMQ